MIVVYNSKNIFSRPKKNQNLRNLFCLDYDKLILWLFDFFPYLKKAQICGVSS